MWPLLSLSCGQGLQQHPGDTALTLPQLDDA